jgi:predicted transcriptional regulator
MTQFAIKTGTEQDFFKRGHKLAEAADRGGRLPDENVLIFEDPTDVMKLVTEARLALFRAVKEKLGSIAEIAERLHRDRSAVKRDVDVLESAGLLTTNHKALRGHGQMKNIRAAVPRFKLQAEVA